MEVPASSLAQAQGLKDTLAAKAIDARHKAWAERMPKTRPILGLMDSAVGKWWTTIDIVLVNRIAPERDGLGAAIEGPARFGRSDQPL